MIIFQLNVPLNLPNRKRTSENLSNGYFDIPVPLCVHDSMLDVRVLSDARGFVAVCHYYLYQVSTYFLNNKKWFILQLSIHKQQLIITKFNIFGNVILRCGTSILNNKVCCLSFFKFYWCIFLLRLKQLCIHLNCINSSTNYEFLELKTKCEF